jgi:integrase
MARNKLSEAKAKALAKPGVYGDGDGLYLRIHKGGTKSWFFIFTRDGKRRELGLGGYGGTAPVSLARAREKADKIREKLANGEDPTVDRTPAGPVTFEKCMRDLLKSKADGWKNPKHGHQWKMTLEEYAKPLHAKPIAEITVGDVEAALLPHWLERPETASRLRGRIQAVIDYAIARGWRTSANPAVWKGLLDKILPAQNVMIAHHAALAYKHAPAFIQKLRTSSGTSARAVEFMALTAARAGEVRGATFAEIDIDAATWTIPAGRMKGGKAHVVPLTDRVIQVVEAMRQQSAGDLLFVGDVSGKPISDTAMTKALRLASPDKKATLHGLRSMFRDWTGDKTEFPREVAEAALAHAVGNAVEQAYRRGSALEKRRELMDAWAAYLNGGK